MYFSRCLFRPSTPKIDSFSLIHRLSFVSDLARRNLSYGHVLPRQDHVYGRLLENCLKQCGKVKSRKVFDEMPHRLEQALRTGKAVHAQSLILGFGSKGMLGNAILDLYAKCGEVGSAEKAFELLEKDITAWNSILSMYSRIGQSGRVLKSFVSLLDIQVSPNVFTFSILLSSCSKEMDVQFGRQTHCSMVKMGLESCSYCGGALVDMYAKCEVLSDAQRAFDELVDPNTVSWTCLFSGYVKAGLPKEAVSVYENIRDIGHRPDRLASVTVMNTYVSLGRLDDSRQLFAEMPSPDVVAWNVMISGHSKRGYEAEAIKYFRDMRKSGVKSSRSTLASVLSAIANMGNLDFGLVVHAEAIKQGLAPSVYVGSSLVSMYTKCGKMEAAEKVFDELEEKNDVLWNSMLRGYAHNGNTHKVMELFMDMKCSGFDLDDYTFTSILSACASLQDPKPGKQFHSIIIKKMLATNLFVGNALVDMYAKCGALEDARQLFERMCDRDNVSWNAIISGYVQEEDEIEAFNLFKRMNLWGMLPDEPCLVSMLNACANIQGLHQGKQVHGISVKCGLETGLYTVSSLIDMYAKCGIIEDARRVLYSVPEWSVVAVNALIGGYSQNNLEKAVILFQEMLARSFDPSEITFAALLDACHEPKSLMVGTQIHGQIIKRGILYDEEYLGISLLGLYMNSHRMREACALFSEFSSPRSPVLWTGMISGYSQNGFHEEALQLYKEMHRNGALSDQATYVSVLHVCSALSSLREDDALKIFYVMRRARIMPDDVTFLGVLTACSHAGKVSEGREIFEMMVSQYGIKPCVDHSACMVDLLGRWGYLREASELIKETENLKPDARLWASLLGACTIHGDDNRGKMAAEKLIELEPDNSAAYVLLSNIYASQGRWEKVNALRKAMRDSGVKKSPGCSWIDVTQKTHVFVAGDKSHPDTVKIETVLKGIDELMRDDSIVNHDMVESTSHLVYV
ncbi:PREDICTED: pentatricopeptide repeat-containing protein At3g09040, mitochondrial isoform X2 [Tarenaya hassleriana]|uniref:pentatricopeptide repeat-containing protein At3g09040, mitochondrial isoform X2 n=1 Tax=Tarenaya hassleriana TaxID=28532 RepID=UPI00053C6092|nr:PREDICTED: pentatricopeptide repeat-containing protein At3g09040, mitochondrial isoform X2 [Tarenaya hassleriana]